MPAAPPAHSSGWWSATLPSPGSTRHRSAGRSRVSIRRVARGRCARGRRRIVHFRERRAADETLHHLHERRARRPARVDRSCSAQPCPAARDEARRVGCSRRGRARPGARRGDDVLARPDRRIFSRKEKSPARSGKRSSPSTFPGSCGGPLRSAGRPRGAGDPARRYGRPARERAAAARRAFLVPRSRTVRFQAAVASQARRGCTTKATVFR